MPKKGKKDSDGGKKAEKKLAAKIIEDKTFGLKNKNKSHAVQKYIKGIVDVTKRKVGLKIEDKSREFQEKADKKKQRQEEAFLNSLYKQVAAVKEQIVPEGVDSKTILCELFKQGKCELGDKCKFSHDLNIEFNKGTFDIYTDLREFKNKFENEVNKIAEEKEKKRKNRPETNIVCKYFLDAVRKKIYGWNWECPNGETCHYKHYLPKNYILLTDKDKEQEDMTIDEYMDLEEQIDAERERIAVNGTKVDDVTFKLWKQKRDEFRNATKDDKDKETTLSKFTGIQLFKKQSDLFKDDDNAEDIKKEDIEKSNDVRIEDDKDELKDNIATNDINEELFKDDANLDDLDNIEDDDKDNKEDNNDDNKDNINDNKDNNGNEEDIKEDDKIEDTKKDDA